MNVASIPMRVVGPIAIQSAEVSGNFKVPMATFETPLWASTNRGAKVSRAVGGIDVVLVDQRMTRSVVVQGPSAAVVAKVAEDLYGRQSEFEEIVVQASRFARLLDLRTQIVGNLLYVRFEMSTGDAAGHNMVTLAAEQILNWMLKEYPDLRYVSISGNYCTDKKVSAVNGILGRGKYVVAEMQIPGVICQKMLRTTPRKIVDLHIKKNLLGTALAGGIRSANAHFANMLLAVYLATGQDAANIVEGSQGFVHAEEQEGNLYFSVTLPNVIVGTVGNGKDLPFVQENLALLDCLEKRKPGENAARLAIIIAATVLCGELSLLAAQTNPGELMRSHVALERAHAGRN